VYAVGDSELLAAYPTPPFLAFVSVEDLLDRMRTQSFSEIVRSLRNERVHGKRYTPRD
jgi:hypothetical protein